MLKIYKKADGLKVALIPQVIMYAEQLQDGLAIKLLDGSYIEILDDMPKFFLNLCGLNIHSLYVKEDGMYIAVNRSCISLVEDCQTYRKLCFKEHAVRVVDPFEAIILEDTAVVDTKKEEFKNYFNFSHFNLN
jgi:hypothetical protein